VVGVGRAAVARHLHAELAAVEQRAVHGVHRVLGVALVVEAHEGEAAALLGVAVPRDVHVPHAAVLLEHPAQRLGRRAVGEVVHFERRHALHVGRRPSVAHLARSCCSVFSSLERGGPNTTTTTTRPVDGLKGKRGCFAC